MNLLTGIMKGKEKKLFDNHYIICIPYMCFVDHKC